MQKERKIKTSWSETSTGSLCCFSGSPVGSNSCCLLKTYIFCIPFLHSVFFSWNAGRSLSVQVDQVPSSILGSPNGSATISCNHSHSLFNVILWYQQPTGDAGLKLIGFTQYKSPTIEEPFKEHFKVTGDGSAKSELHVQKLRLSGDSGMYYCAASSTVTQLHSCLYKNPLW